MNPIRVFIADDGTGLALNLAISLARAGKLALCDSAEEAAVIVAETFRFERSIMADVVTIKWLEEAEESGRLPLTKHFSIDKILSGRKIIVLGKSRKSAVASAWASIYFNLIEHLGGRVEIITDSAEQSQPLRAFCIVQPDDEEFAHPAVEGSSSIHVVSSDWLDACFKENALLPFTNYLLLTSAAGKENRKLENTLQQREEGRLQKRIKLTSCIVPPEQSLPELDPSGRLPVRKVQLSSQFSGAERDRVEAVLKTWKLKTADENLPCLVVCKDGTASEMADATTAVRARFFVSEWYVLHVQRSIAALQRKGPSAKVSGSAVLFRNALLAPPKSRFGIKGMHHFVFTSTGFPDDPALRQDIIQSVKVMGALFLPHLATNLTTHLICPDGIDQNPTEKYSKSISTTFSSIKIVTLAWLAECLIRWELPSETEFSSQSGQQKDLTPPIMSQRVSEDVDFYAASQVSQFTQLRSASPKKSERKPPVPDFAENQQEHNSPLDQEAPKCFLLGSFQGSQQDHAEQIISNLGGILAGKRGDTSFDKDCSHFVVPPDSKRRTEKLLCAIAAGKTILSAKYLEACQKANAFVPEEDFFYEDSILTRQVCQRWQRGQRPFVDMRAVVCADTIPPPDVLCRVISAGGGKAAVLGTQEADELLADGPPTVCFSAKISSGAVLDEVLGSMVVDGLVPVVLPIWVVEFLTSSDSVSSFFEGYLGTGDDSS